MSQTFNGLIIFLMIFLGLTVSYGSTQPNFSTFVQTPINQLQSPFPDFGSALNAAGFVGFKNCGFLDFNCNSSNIAQATVYGFSFIGWADALLLNVLDKLGAVVFLFIGIGQLLNNDFGIPFLGYFMLALFIIVIAEGASTFSGAKPM